MSCYRFVFGLWISSYMQLFNDHQSEIELGNGLPEIRLTTQCIEAAKKAGFEVSTKFLFYKFYLVSKLL